MARTSPASGGPLGLGDPGLIAALREVLLAAGFEGERVRAALGATSELLSRPPDVPLYIRRLEGVEPLGTMVRLFVLDLAVTTEDAERAFAPLTLEQLERLGLVERRAGEVRPTVRLVPHDDLLIVSDRHERQGRPSPADHVAGVHAPTLTLSRLTVRRPVESALDLGTGSGVQAILAARHSGRVVGTDLNVRALNFAAFNAHLNGAQNVEVRAGSYFEPVEGSRFDLIVCNPPYVISPESEYLFRDSGMVGDTVSHQIVRRSGDYLAEGGFAAILVSWALTPGADWSEPLRGWVEGTGCDAWLLHYATHDPLTHAANWTREEFGADPAVFDAALGRWLDYFERLGIGGIGYGAVILRRRTAERNRVVAHELPVDRLGPAGDHILRVFDAFDLLAGLDDERALLDERLVVADASLVRQSVVLSEGQWVVDGITLSNEDGIGFRASLDAPTAGLLAELDGVRTLSDIVDELAGLEGASREAVVDAVLPVVRGMLEAGYIGRAEPRLH